MLESFTPGEATILKKNPNFLREGYPKLDEIIIRIVKDQNALMIAMENGEADMFPFITTSTGIKRMEAVDWLEVTDQG
ncbi:ABC transporter substrate-binding protein [Pikeienuella piscinae]|uniref:ABC transporter substrate-binding protein n=1 Tax=Pikeienuella piscinae TaxID=2748098 RepID=UPI001BAA46A3|nr:ABC transporter substrate-binding protein [Pikeienuella piscinae]